MTFMVDCDVVNEDDILVVKNEGYIFYIVAVGHGFRKAPGA